MPKNILLIEDEKVLRDLIKKNLEDNGYNVETAVDGFEGLEKAMKKPDLIWLDLYLPEMDGPTFMKELRKVKDLASIPIIIATVSRGESDLLKEISNDQVKAIFIKSEMKLAEIIRFVNEKIFGNPPSNEAKS